MIETARLRGVRIEPAHRELLSSALYGDPRVMATLGGALLEGQALEAAVRRGVDHWTEHGFGTWLFFSADDERFVGVGGMRFFDLPEEPARVPGLIYHIAADAWGGWATRPRSPRAPCAWVLRRSTSKPSRPGPCRATAPRGA